jgi:hypothetical protein
LSIFIAFIVYVSLRLSPKNTSILGLGLVILQATDPDQVIKLRNLIIKLHILRLFGIVRHLLNRRRKHETDTEKRPARQPGKADQSDKEEWKMKTTRRSIGRRRLACCGPPANPALLPPPYYPAPLPMYTNRARVNAPPATHGINSELHLT